MSTTPTKSTNEGAGIAPRRGLIYIPLPKEATPVVSAVTVTKKTKWLRRKYQVMYIVSKKGIYEYK